MGYGDNYSLLLHYTMTDYTTPPDSPDHPLSYKAYLEWCAGPMTLPTNPTLEPDEPKKPKSRKLLVPLNVWVHNKMRVCLTDEDCPVALRALSAELLDRAMVVGKGMGYVPNHHYQLIQPSTYPQQPDMRGAAARSLLTGLSVGSKDKKVDSVMVEVYNHVTECCQRIAIRVDEYIAALQGAVSPRTPGSW
jgi:hypothetical protein